MSREEINRLESQLGALWMLINDEHVKKEVLIIYNKLQRDYKKLTGNDYNPLETKGGKHERGTYKKGEGSK